MVATWAAIVMNTPAEAARAPDGETYTTTGTSALTICFTMSRMAVSKPTGRVQLDDTGYSVSFLGLVDAALDVIHQHRVNGAFDLQNINLRACRLNPGGDSDGNYEAD